MKPGFLRTLALLVALVGGVLLPQAHVALPAVRWIIMGMLFLVFLQLRFSKAALKQSHFSLFAANLAIGALGFAGGWALGGRNVALAGFFAGVTPTAAAAPVITGFLRGRVDYVVTAFMLSNLGVAALLPWLLPCILGRPTPDLFTHVLGTVALLVFLPLFLATALRRIYPAAAAWPKRVSTWSFAAWNVSLFIITANASYFLRHQTEIPARETWTVAALSAAICAVSFAVGRLIGGREFSREASQSLGQKNTSFTIYVALTYTNPLVALGPTCYVLWHNLWNSWQLYRDRHRPE
jgi:bile acid:Na+ symporter, BASS family